MINRKCEVVCDICGEQVEDDSFFKVSDKSYALSPSGAINITGRGETLGEKDLCVECHKSYMEFMQPKEQEEDPELPPEETPEDPVEDPSEEQGEGEGQESDPGETQEEGGTTEGEGNEPTATE